MRGRIAALGLAVAAALALSGCMRFSADLTVKADNTVEPRPIQTGTTTGNSTIVISGLEVGERVVTDGQYKLQTGAAVMINTPRPGTKADGQT